MKALTAARLGALGLVAALYGCTAARSGAGAATFERDVGTGSQSDVEREVEQTIFKHQFVIQQKNETPPLFWETRWRPRAPTPEEEELGISNAQVRLLVRARSRGGQIGLGQLFVVTLTIENQVQQLGSDDWEQGVATDSYREWAAELAEDLRQRLDVGIRVFEPPPCCS
jgi:hypothetical protein